LKINGIDVDATLKKVKTVLSEEKGLSPAIKSVVELLVLLVTLLVSRLNLDSRNSSKPPSSDPNRKKVSRKKGDKKAGGQKGHVGVTLQKVNNPDKIKVIKVKRRNLPPGKYWLHNASNNLWTHYFPHKSRGSEAMDSIGILPLFCGVLCHDHLKSYYKYSCTHALCNAHHIRELEGIWENDKHQWARDTKSLLEEIHRAVNEAGGVLEAGESERYRQKYRLILKNGEAECPPPDKMSRKGKRGRVKRTKARNLMERLINFEDDTLRFMDNKIVPFTNNLAENDIRMTKVQQKISGCFRSMKGAKYFCRIRSYLSTCRKQAINLSQALQMLFRGELPAFVG